MSPGISPGELPPFHQMDEYKFQCLCRDLFDTENNIATCDIYGKRGQAQHGIDVLAHRVNGDGIEVGQCRCYEHFTLGKIRTASDEFFAHWDHWSSKDVRRFILFVACDLNNRNQQDEITKQKTRFANVSITYEAWSAAKIANKLRPYPGIVKTYLVPPAQWADIICGVVPPAPQSSEVSETQTPVVVSAILTSELNQLAKLVSGDVEQDLEKMRVTWREGRKSEVTGWLNDIKTNNTRWIVLSSEVKAKLLRFEASLELAMTSDVNQAKALAEEARNLAPQANDSILRALIAYKESGSESAIEILVGQEDIDSLSLIAALYLESGSIEECRTALKLEGTGYEPNAEALRIRALLNLATRDINQAQMDIQKAQELEPMWESIQFTAAVIDYYSALSSSALPEHLVHSPAPVDWVLVKRDDGSLMRLRNAEETFRELSEDTEKGEEERQRLEAWRLACLANNPEQQNEATNYCRSILQTDPTRYHAISWTIARNFGIDLTPSKKALKKLVKDGKAEIPHILALVNCYLASKKAQIAVQLLRDSKALFEKFQADLLWDLWYTQSLIAIHDPEAALKNIDGSKFKDELRPVRTVALTALAKITEDWRLLTDHLKISYKETGDPNFLFRCCELKAWQQDWAYVAERAKQLVDELNTGDALRLAAIALHNDRNYRVCLELLDDNVHLFPQQRLPSELRRIRIHCQQVLGLPDAINEAEQLAHEEPTTENLITLADLYFKRGDLRNLAIVARQLYSLTDLTEEQLLGISLRLQLEDQDISISFWKRAIQQGIPDDLVGSAVSLGFQLGLDKELGPLMSRMVKLGHQAQAGIQIASIEELISFGEEHRTRVAKLEEAYRKGNAPIHVIAEQLNVPLAKLYRGLLEENEAEPDPKRQPPLLTRHGGRALFPGFPDSAPNWHLNLDITGILLGAHIGILDEVENSFKPLHIPIDLIPALIQMRERLTFHQPSMLKAYQQIIDLEERGKLQTIESTLPAEYENKALVEEIGEEWVALFEAVRARNGYLVDFLPLKKRDLSGPPVALPKDANKYVVNCCAVVEALRLKGPLSKQEYDKVLHELGSEGSKSISEMIPKQGKLLYCHLNIPEVFANANILDTVCNRFQVRIEKRELDRLRIVLREHERARALVEWLDGLIERVRNGIDKGIYEVIPLSIDDVDKDPMDRQKETASLHCLFSLLKFEATEGDVIWCDDRYVNGFLRREHVPIISINEVLKALVSIGALDANGYYDKISKLRAANVRFIPIQKDEIIHYLRQARVEEDEMIETAELSVLRRYIAACLLQSEILQRPPLPVNAPNKNGEVAYIIGLSSAIIDALIEIWAAEEDDQSTCRARSEWLINNLYIDHLGLSNVTSFLTQEKDDSYLVAITIAGLVSQAISLKPSRGNESSARSKYFDWIYDRVLRKRFEADPTLLMTVADILKKSILDVHEKMLNESQASIRIRLLQLFHEDLPKPIKDELGRDSDFMAKIGLSTIPVVNIDDLLFDPKDFVAAIREVLEGREAVIFPIKSSEKVLFQPCKDKHSRGMFLFNHPVTGETKTIVDESLELMIDSPIVREAVLKQNRHWFDLPEEQFKQVVAEIVSIEDPWRRVEETRSWQNSSAVVYYANLYQKLTKQEQFQFHDLLPPSSASLLRYLRLKSDTSPRTELHNALFNAAVTLMTQEGLQSAIERLVGLPVSLPTPLIGAIGELPGRDRRALIKRLIRIPGSPVSIIHLLHILKHIGDESPVYYRLIRRIVVKLFNPQALVSFNAFLALLRWVNNEFGHQSDFRNLAPHIRLTLVWAHTHRLFSIFIAAGAPADFLQDTFSQQRITHEMFERDPDYWFDIAHPHYVYRISFLLKGLSYSIGDIAASLVDDRLRKIFIKEAFQEIEGKRIPTLPLLLNFKQAYNSLDSFLGRDYADSYALFLGLEDAGQFSPPSLEALVERLMEERTKIRGESTAWAYLYAVIRDLPLEVKLAGQLKGIMLETNFARLFERDHTSGNLAMQTASLQIFNLKDEKLRSYLKEQLLEITKFIAKEESEEVKDIPDGKAFRESSLLLAEWALNISIANQQIQNVIVDFVSILTHLVQIWPSMTPVIKPIIQCLCEELPINQSQQFWPLIIQLRSN